MKFICNMSSKGMIVFEQLAHPSFPFISLPFHNSAISQKKLPYVTPCANCRALFFFCLQPNPPSGRERQAVFSTSLVFKVSSIIFCLMTLGILHQNLNGDSDVAYESNIVCNCRRSFLFRNHQCVRDEIASRTVRHGALISKQKKSNLCGSKQNSDNVMPFERSFRTPSRQPQQHVLQIELCAFSKTT